MSNSNASTSTLQEYNRTNDDTAIVFKNLVAGTSYNLSCAAYNSLGRGPVNYTVIDTKGKKGAVRSHAARSNLY